jgi:hypothetical protein
MELDASSRGRETARVSQEELPLETGFEIATPVGDNLLNDFVHGTAASFGAQTAALGQRVHEIAGLVSMSDARSPVPFLNRATLLRPVGDLDALLGELRAFYGGHGETPILIDSAWPTPDLRPHGFMLMGHPPLMVRPAITPIPDPPPELRIVPVTDDPTALDWETTLAYGFPVEALQPVTAPTQLSARARTAPGWHHFVGYVDGKAVTAGSAYEHATHVRIDNIATLADARGHGYGNAITAMGSTVNRAKRSMLVASDLGRPVYERLGYVALLRVTYWIGGRAN